MADAVKAEGLVLSYEYDGNIYPLACTKDATITISREFLELAPKTNNAFKRFIPTKKTFTISGSGLVKLVQNIQHPISFFDDMFQTVNTKFTAFLELIDDFNNYKAYQFECYIVDLTMNSVVNNYANYSYTIQGTGAFTEITSSDLEYIDEGLIPARDPALWKLVAVGFASQWYYDYVVFESAGQYYINIGAYYDSIRAVYIPV